MKMLRIISIIFTLLSAANVLASGRPAVDQKIGNVVALRGTVNAERADGSTRSLTIKSPLYGNDTITTGRNGRIQMLFHDSTIISLGRGTEMILTEYSWNESQKSGSMTTTVKQGTFRVMGGAITKYSPKTFKTVTPSATIGIRGSMYAGSISGETLTVVFQGGTGIDVTNGAGTVAISTPGFGTHVESSGQQPDEPVLFSATDMNDINDGMATESDQNSPAQDDTVEQGGEEPQDANDNAPTESPETTDETQTEDEPLPAEITPTADNTSPTDSAVLVDGVSETVSTASKPLENIGATTPTIPSDGISGYKGQISGTGSDGISITGNAFMEVNWKNKKIFGVMEDNSSFKGPPVFFFGSVSGTSLSNVKVFGSQAVDMGVSALEGFGDGLFYGQDYELLTMDATGKEYDLTDAATAIMGGWDVSASMSKDPVQDPADKTSPGGSELWEGFFVGIAEDVNNIDINRKRFANSSSSEFSFTVNKDTGTISGTMNSSGIGTSSGISTIQIGDTGGGGNSAYILDDAFAAILDCSTGNCIESNDLKKVGNFMFTPDPAEQVSQWATWGYWEAAYEDSAHQYHAHVPGTLWVSGVKTPASTVANLISTSFVGNYNGMARGTMFDTGTSPHTFQELKGSSQFTINFGAANPISGKLDFGTNGIYNLDPSTTAVSTSGFSGSFIGTSSITSRTIQLEGITVGNNAQGIIGNYAFDVGAKEITGIFNAAR